jgi:fructose-bisphosphate aldolase class I
LARRPRRRCRAAPPQAQDILVQLARANSQAQLGQYKGPHPVPGGGRILQALRTGGPGK